MTDAEKQAIYAIYQAKRARVGMSTVAMIDYRVTLPDGSEMVERVIGLSQIAAYWPEAIKIERVDACGGFY